MNRRTVRDWLTDIQKAADDGLAFAGGLGEVAFDQLPTADPRTYRAMKNVLAEIGEAVKMLPPELTARHPHINWRAWAGLRDIVTHQYFYLELPRLRPSLMRQMLALRNVTARELGGDGDAALPS